MGRLDELLHEATDRLTASASGTPTAAAAGRRLGGWDGTDSTADGRQSAGASRTVRTADNGRRGVEAGGPGSAGG